MNNTLIKSLLLGFALASASTQAAELLITNVKLINGDAASSHEAIDILVRGNKIKN